MNEYKEGRLLRGESFSKVIGIAGNYIGITFDDKYRYGQSNNKFIKFDFIYPLLAADRPVNLNIFGMIAYVDSDIFAAVSDYLRVYGLKYVDIEPNDNGNGWKITTFKPVIPSSSRWSNVESQIYVKPDFSQILDIPQLAVLMVQFIVDEISYKTEDFIDFNELRATYTINTPHSFRKNIKKEYDIFYPDKSLFQSSTKYIVKGLKHSTKLNPDSIWKIVITSNKK